MEQLQLVRVFFHFCRADDISCAHSILQAASEEDSNLKNAPCSIKPTRKEHHVGAQLGDKWCFAIPIGMS